MTSSSYTLQTDSTNVKQIVPCTISKQKKAYTLSRIIIKIKISLMFLVKITFPVLMILQNWTKGTKITNSANSHQLNDCQIQLRKYME